MLKADGPLVQSGPWICLPMGKLREGERADGKLAQSRGGTTLSCCTRSRVPSGVQARVDTSQARRPVTRHVAACRQTNADESLGEGVIRQSEDGESVRASGSQFHKGTEPK